jgi:CDP-glycerol glycerophosphotransferase
MRDMNSEPEFPSSRTGARPLISIVIPTYKLEKYITSCLDSITRQEFRNIEIIVVDGGSDDQTLELLEKRMTDEPRLSVEVLGRPGPGQARDLGVQKASGEYIWFVDGDDQITEHCLTPVSDRLLAESPDVLLIRHAVVREDKTRRPGQDDYLLTRENADTFTVADRPWLLDLSLVCWNKIVRRDFYRSTGAAFAESWPHEDVPVSCELMLSAKRIAVLNHVCYLYLRQRAGAATAPGGRRDRHFTVFATWRSVLDTAQDTRGGDGHDPDLYTWLFQRAIWHCSTILETPGYVTGRCRRAFFHQLSALYRDYAPTGYTRPTGFRGIKFWLFAHRSYLGYQILEPFNRWRVAARTRRTP